MRECDCLWKERSANISPFDMLGYPSDSPFKATIAWRMVSGSVRHASIAILPPASGRRCRTAGPIRSRVAGQRRSERVPAESRRWPTLDGGCPAVQLLRLRSNSATIYGRGGRAERGERVVSRSRFGLSPSFIQFALPAIAMDGLKWPGMGLASPERSEGDKQHPICFSCLSVRLREFFLPEPPKGRLCRCLPAR
jgi:hypothetical protein